MATRPVLRIFISSTAIDLRDYREKVRDAVLSLEGLPIGMETFSALGGQPASESMRLAAEADAVICIVAHRYGYVPPPDLGGDGDRSITWLEVDAAKRAGKPVFAFLIDPNAPWTGLKEQGRLQKLQEFKAYLEHECVLRTFTSLDDLATQVTLALAKFTPQQSSTTRAWQPLFCHALQPAQHFRGREAKLQDLNDWLQAPITPDRVISVVAAGGAGKTALVHEALYQATPSDRAGLFVWSFYEDPHTDAFLREAYTYFTGEENAPAGGMLERLQLALSGDLPHVLILDGLERVQSEGGPRPRGELEDLQLKRLLHALAGGVGSARALVTSRFPLVDLGAGHRAIELDDLERPAALEVLRAWGVKGDDAALARLIEPLNLGGLYHALSVAVLGSYLGNYPDRTAPAFSLEDAKDSDPKARRLSRILEQYAHALTAAERDLLARLALFPRGVKVELLAWIVQSGGDLLSQLERLKALGLYPAHPFLSEFFRNLLGTTPESVHESVRARLAASLEARPSTKPSDPAILDQYELLIEETLLAGRPKQAVELYWYGLGAYRNLVWVLGENVRGLRILERFVPSLIEGALPGRVQGGLLIDLGLYAANLGDLSRARAAFSHARQLAAGGGDLQNECVCTQNLAEFELQAGRFRKAREYSESAVSLATEMQEDSEIAVSLAYRATAHFALGDIAAAAADFARATELNGKPLYSVCGIWQAWCRLLRGDRQGALSLTQANREFAAGGGYDPDLCRSNALLARLLLPDDPAQAARHLQDARAFANRSGQVELQLRCFHAACDLDRHLGNYPQAIAEAEAGILLADTCGFGLAAIDLRLALAETHLAAGDASKALQNARTALDRSEHPDCQYAWGQADALRLCGLARR